MTTQQKVNLLGLSRPQMEEFFLAMGEKKFRAQQVLKWIHHHQADSFEQMTDVGKALRQKLSEVAEIRGSAEGTVKAHLNAIYRKAGVQGRNGLMSLLIEDLMGAPLVPHETPEDARATLRTGGGNSRSAG